MRTLTLSEILDGWPVQLGDTLAELASMANDTFKSEVDKLDPDTSTVAWTMRKQAQEISRRSEREIAFSGYPATDAALRDRAVHPVPGKWIVYALDDQHRRVLAPQRQGKSMFQLRVYAKFPAPDEAPANTPGGSYLAIWGGRPDVFEIPGVAERIVHFAHAHTLLDVSCWDSETSDHWSLRSRALTRGDGSEDFIDYGPLAEKGRQAWASSNHR